MSLPRRIGGHVRHNLVAYIALFFAITGSAVAASSVLIDSSRQVGKGVINSGDVRNNGLTSADLRNRKGVRLADFTPGALAALRDSLGPGPAGPQGPAGQNGQNGQNGTAIAYAYVESTGNVVEGMSKNITDAMVTYAPVGGYCFDLPFEVRNVVANTHAASNEGVAAVIITQGTDANGGCEGEDVVVETRTPSTGAVAAKPFYVLFN